MVAGAIIVIAYSVYARMWVPFRGVKLLSERLEQLPEAERYSARRTWVLRHAFLQFGVLAVFIGMMVFGALVEGGWESTWRDQSSALIFWLFMPVAGGLGGWVYYYSQARRAGTWEASPTAQVAVGEPVAVVDRDFLRARYRSIVLRCLAVSLVPGILVLSAAQMTGGTDTGGPNTGTISTAMLLVFGTLALSPLLLVPFLRFSYGPRTARTAVNPAAAIVSNSLSEYAIWALSPLMGFVIFFSGGTWAIFFGSFALALIGWVATFPRLSRWMQLADEQDVLAASRVVR